MFYETPYTLSKRLGNNIFSYEERESKKGEKPSLIIPSVKIGKLEDIKLGTNIVFEEMENGELKSCSGIQNFIQLQESTIPTTIFDNHNHALYFWIEAIHKGQLNPGFELIHIDEHSDLWLNENSLMKKRALSDISYVWEFTNFSCNVGNYIDPALKNELISKMIRIENEYQIDSHTDYVPNGNCVLNIDLDFFAPEMDFIDEQKKLRFIQNLLPKVQCITIATSPFFIDQKKAIESLYKIYNI